MYIFYTDGSALGNPGPGGAATVLVEDDQVLICLYTSSQTCTTNNRMELAAMILTLEIIRDCLEPNDQVVVYTDSNYVLKGLSEWLPRWLENGWRTAKRKPVVNKDLWQQAWGLYQKLANVRIRKIKAHSGHYYNDLADTLAKRGAREAV